MKLTIPGPPIELDTERLPRDVGLALEWQAARIAELEAAAARPVLDSCNEREPALPPRYPTDSHGYEWRVPNENDWYAPPRGDWRMSQGTCVAPRWCNGKRGWHLLGERDEWPRPDHDGEPPFVPRLATAADVGWEQWFWIPQGTHEPQWSRIVMRTLASEVGWRIVSDSPTRPTEPPDVAMIATSEAAWKAAGEPKPADPPPAAPTAAGVTEVGGGWTLAQDGDAVTIGRVDDGCLYISALTVDPKQSDALRSLASAARLGYAMVPRRFDPERDRDERYLVASKGESWWWNRHCSFIEPGDWIRTMPPPPPEGGAS